jgi:hypothetical protein
MKTFRCFRVEPFLAAAVLLLTTSAKATLTLDLPAVHINQESNPTAAEIATALGIPVGNLGTLLFKLDRDTLQEEGTMQSAYSALYTPSDGTGATTINWNGPGVAAATYLLIKDGTEGSYVWNIQGWNGMEQIVVADVFGAHAVSHVEFFGNVVSTPEPTTAIAAALLLLPLGVSAFRTLRNKRS